VTVVDGDVREVTAILDAGTYSEGWRPGREQAITLPPRDGQSIAGVARVR
jgi:hypothetical protein